MNTSTRCCQEMSPFCSDDVACDGSESGLSAGGRFTSDHSMRKRIGLAFLSRRAEASDDGFGDIDEVAVMHPEAIGMCPGIEHHFRIADETLLYEDTLEVE